MVRSQSTNSLSPSSSVGSCSGPKILTRFDETILFYLNYSTHSRGTVLRIACLLIFNGMESLFASIFSICLDDKE